MSAICWGCALGVTPVETPLPRFDPLGACWECHVFGCPAHAERDAAAGKYLCYPSVAQALSVSAGLESAPVSVRFEKGELERRLPRLAGATREERRRWSSGEREGVLGAALADRALDVDFHLLAEALGIVSFLGLASASGAAAAGVMAGEGHMSEEPAQEEIVGGRLGQLARELLR